MNTVEQTYDTKSRKDLCARCLEVVNSFQADNLSDLLGILTEAMKEYQGKANSAHEKWLASKNPDDYDAISFYSNVAGLLHGRIRSAEVYGYDAWS